MATRSSAIHVTTAAPTRDAELVAVYGEGIRAGLVGAATIALWFFVVDLLNGRPLYTPTLLGTAVFGGADAVRDPATIAPSLEMVVSFTWIHTLAFVLVGIAAAWLLSLAERNASYGFGILLLFAIVESGFIAACMLFFEPVLRALAWPAVVVGNLLAALAMAGLFWRRHRHMVVAP
jgi:hypothetical protein